MCGGPAWKREIVPDHKFDFVDTREFTDNGFGMRMKYLWLYIIVLKSFLVYVSDIFTATTMLTTSGWHQQFAAECQGRQGCFEIPAHITKWLFIACIILSFALLAYETRKTKKIIASRDISYAFTNIMANHYYSLRSYDHFCFFEHISNSTKLSDDFAFFVFFTFKSWKRLLLADGARQTINALTLYSIYLAKEPDGKWYDVPKYFKNNALSTSALMVTMSLTVAIFAGSLLILIVAGICYVPLLCHIRGNLKEYCCHKVDKRIDMIIKRRQKQRLADAAKLARKEAMGDFTHLKNKKGEFIAKPAPQPTLPNLSVDDDFDDGSSYKLPPPSTYTQDTYYYSDSKVDYPPMPAYNQPYSTHQTPSGYGSYNPSLATQDDPYQQRPAYDDEADNMAYIPTVPYAPQPYDRRTPSPTQYSQYGSSPANYVADPHDVYRGQAMPNEMTRRSPLPYNSGLAYDDGQSAAGRIDSQAMSGHYSGGSAY
jgi:hypothetical protein